MRHDQIRNDAAGHAGAKYRQAGATLVELAVAATVLAVLAAVFLLRLLDAQEQAEKISMEATVENMRAGLRAQVGALLIADRTSTMRWASWYTQPTCAVISSRQAARDTRCGSRCCRYLTRLPPALQMSRYGYASQCLTITAGSDVLGTIGAIGMTLIGPGNKTGREGA